MSTELRYLAFSIMLGLVQIMAAAGLATAKRGAKWNLSSRDTEQPALTGVAGRMERALENFKETFPLFAAAVLGVLVANKTSQLSGLGCAIYFWARLIYVPIYAAGISGVRTAVWLASLVGLIVILVALVL